MIQALTPAGSFYGFAIISAASVFFYALVVPETKGKTLEQVNTVLTLFHTVLSYLCIDSQLGA
jgi:Sugar (and other) transporter